jgi:hypothetical protein
MKLSTLLTSAALAVLTPAVQAGPPLICHAIDIGQAKSLPWTNGSHWDGAVPTYQLDRLIPDTFALLTPQTPVLVRMETLRRAAIYSSRNPGTGFELLTHLMARTLNNEKDGLAWFDAGYLVETFRQYEFHMKRKVPQGFDGYAWTQKAIRLSGPNAEMEFAAALIQSHSRWPNDHLQRARSAAEPGSLLARNMDKWK